MVPKWCTRSTAWTSKGGSGRDPGRIDPFLERLFHLWMEHPTLRFGELVSEPAFRRRGKVAIFPMEDEGDTDQRFGQLVANVVRFKLPLDTLRFMDDSDFLLLLDQ